MLDRVEAEVRGDPRDGVQGWVTLKGAAEQGSLRHLHRQHLRDMTRGFS